MYVIITCFKDMHVTKYIEVISGKKKKEKKKENGKC